MKPKPKFKAQAKAQAKLKPNATIMPERKVADRPSQQTAYLGRDGLAAYTVDPDSFPTTRIIYYNEKFVVINDLYPKATVHLLILPRDRRINTLRPQEAFDDPAFLTDCIAEERKVRQIAISELRRKVGKSSVAEKPRIEAMESSALVDELPPGRDWDKEIISGTHANPSMNHLHIHVMSRDLHSECLKKRAHYQSFTTDFFINLAEYPLVEDDPRRKYKHFPDDMLCWRCGRNFKNRMVQLKGHLEEEFEEWKKE